MFHLAPPPLSLPRALSRLSVAIVAVTALSGNLARPAAASSRVDPVPPACTPVVIAPSAGERLAAPEMALLCPFPVATAGDDTLIRLLRAALREPDPVQAVQALLDALAALPANPAPVAAAPDAPAAASLDTPEAAAAASASAPDGSLATASATASVGEGPTDADVELTVEAATHAPDGDVPADVPPAEEQP